MLHQYLFIGTLLMVAAGLSAFKNKLTPVAAIAGWMTGILIFGGAGWPGLLMLAAFFALGTWATFVGKEKKEQLGLTATGDSRRTAAQVFANAGVAAILSAGMLLNDAHNHTALLMIAASFASATADTVSSELGNVFGTRYFNIITLRKDERGLDGVVSAEGTILGVAGSIIIGFCYSVFAVSLPDFIIIVAAGTVGNIADSFLGANAERKGLLTNNAVNSLNTLVAAVSAFLLAYFLA